LAPNTVLPRQKGLLSHLVLSPKLAPLHPTAARQRKQLVKDNLGTKAETLGTEADQTPKGERRSQLVDQIADPDVEYQSEPTITESAAVLQG
jgi:hypothetical protein